MGSGIAAQPATQIASMINRSESSVTPRYTPNGPTEEGEPGQFCYDDEYLYLCVANNNWRRIMLEEWS